jgi:hypothetical protein
LRTYRALRPHDSEGDDVTVFLRLVRTCRNSQEIVPLRTQEQTRHPSNDEVVVVLEQDERLLVQFNRGRGISEVPSIDEDAPVQIIKLDGKNGERRRERLRRSRPCPCNDKRHNKRHPYEWFHTSSSRGAK